MTKPKDAQLHAAGFDDVPNAADPADQNATGGEDGAGPAEGESGPGTDLVETCPDLPYAVTFDDDEEAVRPLQQWLRDESWYGLDLTGAYDLATKQGVQRVQRWARDAGWYEGPIDGLWNADVRAAVCSARTAD